MVSAKLNDPVMTGTSNDWSWYLEIPGNFDWCQNLVGATKQERASKYFNHYWFFGFDMQQ